MLLGILRKKARSIFIYVAFGIIIVVFIFFFGWGELPGRQEGWVVKVNGRAVPHNSYSKHYNQLLNLYERLYKEKLNSDVVEKLGLKQKAVDNLVNNAVLLGLAEKTRLVTARSEAEKAIREMPAFQTNGQFDFKKYEQLLRLNRMTPEDFEKDQNQEAAVSLIRNLILDGTKYSDGELWEQYKRENEKANLECLEIDPAVFEQEQKIGVEEIRKYFEVNKERFRVPEKTKVAYIGIGPKDFEKEANITDTQIADYYRDYSEEFWQPKKIHARHILIKGSANAKPAEKEEARKKAEEVLALVKSGKPFEEVAKQYSQDPGSAPQGGDLGFFPRGQMVKPFEDAAFGLKPGEASDIVETQFGFHIIRVDEVKEEGTEPLDVVREKIRKELTDEKTRELSKTEAHRAYRTLLKSKDLKDYAAASGRKLAETEFFAREETPPPFGEFRDTIQEIFSLNPGEMPYPLLLGEKYFLVKILDKQKSRLPGLEEVKETIETALKKQKQLEMARKKGEELLRTLKGGKPFQEVAAQARLTIKETGPFTRGGTVVPSIGEAPDLAVAAFALSMAHPYPDRVFEANGRVYLVRLKAKEEADYDVFGKKKREVEVKYLAEKQSRYLEDWLRNARLHANVVLNPRFTP